MVARWTAHAERPLTLQGVVMPRPHIEFIQQQDLSFERVDLGAETGASSSLIAFSAGWRRRETSHLLVDEELYVLSGDLTLSDVTYTEHCYCFLPSGYTRSDSYSERGALVLAFSSAERERIAGEAPRGSVDK